ncbi:DUF1702 family protein [Actinomadura sp. 3N407]|uniref:DUF1702 family protein n=1 Tax=Actinomadura sp. 3N407 TaxID=3457423 RepID=UPI003FCD4858
MVRTFLLGYNAVARSRHPQHVQPELDRVEPYHRPFAYEGACMGFGPWAVMALKGYGSFEPLMVKGLAPRTVYQNYVGLGWWLGMWYSRRPARLAQVAGQFDYRYRLLVYEGLGFRSGFLRGGAPDATAPFLRHGPVARHVCYQGYGRSLWFVFMDDLDGAHAAITRLPENVRGDCYSGLGLGCAFSRLDRPGLAVETAARIPDAYRPDFLQGAAFGWEARRLADPVYFLELTGTQPEELRAYIRGAVETVHSVRDRLIDDGWRQYFYQMWRRETRSATCPPPEPAATSSTQHPRHPDVEQR